MKIASFLRHRLRAGGRYQVHSPFVYEFVTQVLPHRLSPQGAAIEALRKRLGRSQEPLSIQDYGAGYGGDARPLIHKTLAQVVRGSARRRKEGELLRRMAAFYQPARCLELGTNLGFSGLYLSAGLPAGSSFLSLEGAAALSAIAQRNFETLGYKGQFLTGPFRELMQNNAELQAFQPDLVFMDGDHRERPTIEYFEWLLPRVNDGALIVLDDIHWSQGMENAWNHIIAMREVTVSADLWSLGLCWIRRNQAKEHFLLRF